MMFRGTKPRSPRGSERVNVETIGGSSSRHGAAAGQTARPNWQWGPIFSYVIVTSVAPTIFVVGVLEHAPVLPLFQVFQTRVQNLLDAPQVGTPQVPHIVEALIHALEPLVNPHKPPIDSVELCTHPQNHQADNRAIECHRRDDRDDLLVCHLILILPALIHPVPRIVATVIRSPL
jgi:hypothetical protein